LINEQCKQRLIGGFGLDQSVGGIVQDGFKNGEILGLIIDNQDVDRLAARMPRDF
jgi:hypothetical protein